MSRRAVMALLELAFSPSVTAVRALLLGLSLLLITGVIRMDKLDISMFGVSDEYIVPMLIAAILGSFLAAFTVRRALHNRAADNKVANGKIPDTNSLPYDPKYDCGTLAAFVIACAAGLFTAPVLVDAVTVNAGMWTSALAAGGLALVLCAVLIYVFHFGLPRPSRKRSEPPLIPEGQTGAPCPVFPPCPARGRPATSRRARGGAPPSPESPAYGCRTIKQ